MPVALVTGAAGQDGSYLAERLLADGYAVHALVRPGTPIPVERPRGAATESTYHEVDLTDHARLGGLVDAIEPDEIYNLAGVSSVAQSWTAPVLTAEVSGVAAVVLLDQALKLQRRLGRPHLQHQLAQPVVRIALDVEFRTQHLLQVHDVLAPDVALVGPRMYRDALSAEELAVQRNAHHVGVVAAAGVAQGRDFVDVYA